MSYLVKAFHGLKKYEWAFEGESEARQQYDKTSGLGSLCDAAYLYRVEGGKEIMLLSWADTYGFDFADEEEPESDFCHHCGKNIYDFSDLGCGKCDARHPDWGMMP